MKIESTKKRKIYPAAKSNSFSNSKKTNKSIPPSIGKSKLELISKNAENSDQTIRTKKKHKKNKEKATESQITTSDGNNEAVKPLKIVNSRNFEDDLRNYLSEWNKKIASDKNNAVESSWKFNKVLQAWSLEHIFDKDKISSDLFKMLIPYVATIRGGALDRLILHMNNLIDGKQVSESDDNDLKNSIDRAVKLKKKLIDLCVISE
eukprot:gene14991-20166_t